MSRTVLVIPDLHYPVARRGHIDFLKKQADIWQPTRIVCIGDIVDNCAYSFHKKPGSLLDPLKEREAALKDIAKLVKEFPKADLLTGNHDALVARRAEEIGLDISTLKSFNAYWELPSTWKVHPRFHQLKIDGTIYAHGDRAKGGATPAIANAKELFCSYVQGHTHGAAGVNWHVNGVSRIFGLNVGCLVDDRALAMAYGKVYNKRGVLGCGVVTDNGKCGHFVPWLLRSVN